MILKSLWGSLDAQKQLRIHLLPWLLQQSLCCWKQIESLKVHEFSLVFLLSLASGFQKWSGQSGQLSPRLTRLSAAGHHNSLCCNQHSQYCGAQRVGMEAWELCWVPNPSPPGSGSWGRWREIKTSLPLPGTKFWCVTKKEYFSRVWADLNGHGGSVIFCSVQFGVVEYKSSRADILKPHSTCGFLLMGSQQKKKSMSVIYRAIQLPQLGMEEGAWPTDLGVGS